MAISNITAPTLRAIPGTIRTRQVGGHQGVLLHLAGIAARRPGCTIGGEVCAVALPLRIDHLGKGIGHGEFVDGGEVEVVSQGGGFGDLFGSVGLRPAFSLFG